MAQPWEDFGAEAPSAATPDWENFGAESPKGNSAASRSPQNPVSINPGDVIPEQLGRARDAVIPQAMAKTPSEASLPYEALRTQRQEVPQFWDTETPVKGLPTETEDEYIRLLNDRNVSPEDVAKYLVPKGYTVNPADITAAREQSAKSGLPIGLGGYERAPVVADLPDDGIVGAATRGLGMGVLSGGLDELGAAVDTLGGTENRENIFNSDRRVADIWYDNQRKNSAILNNDHTLHPYAQSGGEFAGALAIPFGARAKTIGELASVGGAYGVAHGFLGTDGTYSDRARGALTEGALGAVGGAVLGKAFGFAGSRIPKKLTKEADEVAEKVGNVVGDEAAINAPVAEDAVTKMNRILAGTEALNKEQKALYTAQRRERAIAGREAAKLTEGEAGFYSELSTLKGSMDRVDFQPQREHFSQEEVDSLFDSVKAFGQTDQGSFYDSIAARNGLLKVMEGEVPTPSEVQKLADVFGTEFAKNVSKHRGKVNELSNVAMDALTLPRALQSTLDLSAPLRQGINLVGTKNYWKSFGSMFKQAKSQEAFDAIQQGIRNRETYPLMEEFGLALTDTGREMSKREEAFASRWAEKIPGVKGSERAYVGFLNKLRADTFDDLLNKVTNAGIDITENPEYVQSIAKYVNAATGRGDLLPSLEQASNLLNATFYSPRLISSRIQTLNPYTYYKMPKEVRQEALKNLLSMSAITSSVLGLAALNGAEVEVNPLSSDFAKAKVGDTRYDILGGYGQYLTFASRMATSLTKTLKGDTKELGSKFGQDNRLDLTERFFENKFAPVPGFIRDWMRGTNPVGEPFDPAVATTKLFIPLILQDMAELVQQNGPSGVPMALPAIFGVGVQTYGNKAKPSLENLDAEHPVNKELSRLKELNEGKDLVGKPDKTWQIEGESFELSEPQQLEYKRETEKDMTTQLDEIIKNPVWSELTDAEKIEAVKELRSEVRKDVKERMLEQMLQQPTP